MKTKLYTQAEVAKLYKEGLQRGINGALSGVLACVALNLMDKAGMSAEEAVKVLEAVRYQCDSVNRGDITFLDITETLKDEYGLEIEMK